MNDAGEPVILVLTENAAPAGRLPKQIDGIEVQERVVGKLVAMKGPPGGGGDGGGGGGPEAAGDAAARCFDLDASTP